MSLINEALKRARLEAARQDAAKKGYVLSSEQSLYRPSHGRGRPDHNRLLIGMVTLVLAIAAIALLYFGVKRRALETDIPRYSPVARGQGIEEAYQEQPNGLSGDLTNPLPGRNSRLDATTSESAAENDIDSVAPQALGGNSSVLEGPAPTGSPLDRPASDIEPENRPTGSTPATETFVREFTLSDGTRVELGGIAWSETGPYALVNGRVVGVGEFVGDLAIESIYPTHILLKGRDRRVQVTLR